jgi:hypothetical protein
MSGKKRASARAAVKNGRRIRRHGRKPWMAGQPVMKQGMGGTDKSGTVKPSKVYYSQATAERLRGHPSEWLGIPKREK